MIDDLLISIGRQLNIPQSEDSEWACRVVYSVAGQMALASLWDQDEDSSSVSVQHFKTRITGIFDAYEGIYPKIGTVFPKDKADLIEDMYSIYLRNGFFYHTPHQLSPAVYAVAGNGSIALHRGGSPDDKLSMSGLGFYSYQKPASDRTIARMFGLQEQSFEEYFEELLGDRSWEPIEWPDNAEFLRLDPPFKRGYWQQIPGKDGRISLARYGEPNKIFVFYRWDSGIYQQKPIPEWRLRDHFSNEAGYGEYRRIAIALLKRYETFPEIKARDSGNFVEVKVGYRLPPSEEEFFKLYSWPVRYDFDKKSPPVFTRMMAKQIYPMFKSELESIGYCFAEE